VTAQTESREGSPIAVAIDEKLGVREIMVLGESMQERCGGIGATSAEQLDVHRSVVSTSMAA